jgi:hypothetical protein
MIRPLGNRVLVKRLPLPDTLQSGLYLLGREYPTIGEVLAVGRGWVGFAIDDSHKIESSSGTEYPLYFDYVHIEPISDIRVGDQVQWDAGLPLDTRQVGPDLFIIDYDDLNLAITPSPGWASRSRPND